VFEPVVANEPVSIVPPFTTLVAQDAVPVNEPLNYPVKLVATTEPVILVDPLTTRPFFTLNSFAILFYYKY